MDSSYRAATPRRNNGPIGVGLFWAFSVMISTFSASASAASVIQAEYGSGELKIFLVQ